VPPNRWKSLTLRGGDVGAIGPARRDKPRHLRRGPPGIVEFNLQVVVIENHRKLAEQHLSPIPRDHFRNVIASAVRAEGRMRRPAGNLAGSVSSSATRKTPTGGPIPITACGAFLPA
jgi:hypothetical protein